MELSASPNAVQRILDANLDRAREGLRVIEDWCRFGLENRELTAECKDLRQAIAAWHGPELRAARNTPEDPGTTITHEREEQRSTLGDLLQANLCRVQEALRVVEEYGKLYEPRMGEAFKQMRYRVYALESQLMMRDVQPQDRRQRLYQSQLYLVTSPVDNLLEVVEAALQGGLALVQYRDKSVEDGIRFTRAKQLCDLCHRYGALFLVNDRPDIALAVDADGVHVGQQDLDPTIVRQLLGVDRIIGMSTTNPDELQRALASNVDYVGVGPVYETPTKAGKAAAGLSYVRYAAEQVSIPWYAIGSVDLTNLKDVMAAGATRVAVVRAIMQAPDPKAVTEQFLAQLHHATVSPSPCAHAN
ncbi:MAG: thiamine phosphate synthase [Cyanobacteria bacterium]|nr:thiamine phosphate synthase [Cyanobacteriota bacterium]MDW8200102.1 thiamine phosphate synthase [Cyanobacteriota bacterium SKYGB_h_bin112]